MRWTYWIDGSCALMGHYMKGQGHRGYSFNTQYLDNLLSQNDCSQGVYWSKVKVTGGHSYDSSTMRSGVSKLL